MKKQLTNELAYANLSVVRGSELPLLTLHLPAFFLPLVVTLSDHQTSPAEQASPRTSPRLCAYTQPGVFSMDLEQESQSQTGWRTELLLQFAQQMETAQGEICRKR